MILVAFFLPQLASPATALAPFTTRRHGGILREVRLDKQMKRAARIHDLIRGWQSDTG